MHFPSSASAALAEDALSSRAIPALSSFSHQEVRVTSSSFSRKGREERGCIVYICVLRRQHTLSSASALWTCRRFSLSYEIWLVEESIMSMIKIPPSYHPQVLVMGKILIRKKNISLRFYDLPLSSASAFIFVWTCRRVLSSR